MLLCWLVGWLINVPAMFLCWLVGWLIGCLTSQQHVCWLVGCLTFQQHACLFVGWLAGCLTSQQYDSFLVGWLFNVPAFLDLSVGRAVTPAKLQIKICLTRSQYTDTRPTSPSAGPITAGTWQRSHWGVVGLTGPGKSPGGGGGVRIEPRPAAR